jgi:hypothetical protein
MSVPNPAAPRAQAVDTRLTPAQAGRRLDLTPKRIHQLFDQGLLAGERTPLGRLIDASSVEALARAREQGR